LGVVERERMAAGKRLGVVKNAARVQSPWTTPGRLEELSGEWSVAVGSQESRRRRSGAVQHVAALRPWQGGCRELVREWMGKQRRFEKKVRAMIFYFFCADGSVACWVVRTSRPTSACQDETDAIPTTLLIRKGGTQP
jgi:hypothetical protein